MGGAVRLGDTGPKLILLPGTLGRAQILALSYPDSGGLEDWAADVAALLAQEDMQGAVVLGSSMGATRRNISPLRSPSFSAA